MTKYAIVPVVEPTRTMLDAWHEAMLGACTHRNHPSATWKGVHWSDSEAGMVAAYSAMLAHRPPLDAEMQEALELARRIRGPYDARWTANERILAYAYLRAAGEETT